MIGSGRLRSRSHLFDLQLAQDSIQRKVMDFDPTGDTHYDLASAFIKSLRGSDPDAALYWLARMLEGGEDPRFVARRLVIFASEDVGNADPFGAGAGERGVGRGRERRPAGVPAQPGARGLLPGDGAPLQGELRLPQSAHDSCGSHYEFARGNSRTTVCPPFALTLRKHAPSVFARIARTIKSPGQFLSRG